ncbi:hypothetical protein ROU88_07335 [Macrococcus capreoli]|uniref:hypothetical protein n=1 Tax=Macrococcus capreoli TaxID=2982690 RepID=UPI0021D60D15|nr:hypothetical protein [Macrococcus sp. TMW 2.2395]MCU7557735.1 hypothetical protein [Macrococcus sp. TMW 2.2395]
MIKVVFTYTTPNEYLPELMAKFQASADSKFNSEVSNTGIKMYKKSDATTTTIALDIFYNSIEDYETRTQFERSQDDWNRIWFADDIKHTLQSVEVFECL